MYTLESVTRRIRSIGAHAFIEFLHTTTLSEDVTAQLEDIHIMKDGIPCVSIIYSLAQ